MDNYCAQECNSSYHIPSHPVPGPLRRGARFVCARISGFFHRQPGPGGAQAAGAGAAQGKKKILICTNHSYMLYQFRRELIERLVQDYEVVLSMPFVGHEDDFEAMGCRCVKTRLDRRSINPFTDLQLLAFYNRLLKREKPDKVITYSIKPNIYAGLLCRLRRIPYCANVQGLGTAFQKKGLAQFVGLLYRLAFGRVQVVFFENSTNAQEFAARHLVRTSRIRILNGAGVNLKRYTYLPHQNTGDTRHFLFVGRIMREKGVEELFEAIRRLRLKYGSRAILDIVGFFEEEYAETVKQMQREGAVAYHGFQTDPRPFYRLADVVVLPSWHEGMSNVLLEASAMGRPVITSNIPGCREAVEDGRTGYLCAPKNAEMLCHAMEQMMGKTVAELDEMGRAARRRMETLFDKQQVVLQTMDMLGLPAGSCAGAQKTPTAAL